MLYLFLEESFMIGAGAVLAKVEKNIASVEMGTGTVTRKT